MKKNYLLKKSPIIKVSFFFNKIHHKFPKLVFKKAIRHKKKRLTHKKTQRAFKRLEVADSQLGVLSLDWLDPVI